MTNSPMMSGTIAIHSLRCHVIVVCLSIQTFLMTQCPMTRGVIVIQSRTNWTATKWRSSASSEQQDSYSSQAVYTPRMTTIVTGQFVCTMTVIYCSHVSTINIKQMSG